MTTIRSCEEIITILEQEGISPSRIDDASFRWAGTGKHRMALTLARIMACHPAPWIIQGMMRDLGMPNPDDPGLDESLSFIDEAAHALSDCPEPLLSLAFGIRYGKFLDPVCSLIVGSNIARAQDSKMAYLAALYLPNLNYILQENLRRIVLEHGDEELLRRFDGEVQLQSRHGGPQEA